MKKVKLIANCFKVLNLLLENYNKLNKMLKNNLLQKYSLMIMMKTKKKKIKCKNLKNLKCKKKHNKKCQII